MFFVKQQNPISNSSWWAHKLILGKTTAAIRKDLSSEITNRNRSYHIHIQCTEFFKKKKSLPRNYGKCRLLVPKKLLQPTDLLFLRHHHLVYTPTTINSIKIIRSLTQLRYQKKITRKKKFNSILPLNCIVCYRTEIMCFLRSCNKQRKDQQ